MVALVEDDALQRRRLAVLLEPPCGARAVEGGLRHHQRMIGHDQIGATAGADGLFDKAQAIVGAGGVDALAAPVDQIGRSRLMHGRGGIEARQPAGIIAPRHVAVAGVGGPARGQGHADQVAVPQLRRLHHVLKIEQAEVVLAPLPHHRLAPPFGLVGPQGAALAVDLALQGAGIGRDPRRPGVALGPQAGGRQIAQGLARSGAGLGQQDARAPLLVARREGVSRLGRIVGLGGPRLVQARGLKQLVQTDAGALGIDRRRPGLAARRLVLPLLQPRPNVEARAALLAIAQRSGAQGLKHARRPAPSRPLQRQGQRIGLLTSRIGGRGQFGQQVGGGGAQGGGLGFGAPRLLAS
ncbi:hypothetical protein D3C77_444220 [compost metagenome]